MSELPSAFVRLKWWLMPAWLKEGLRRRARLTGFASRQFRFGWFWISVGADWR
ncbi:MAG: hypothetical protein KDJ44_21670 [Rhodoblastus sp.]|nr:hypothetical protein [Rhodoblastus sp.]